MINLLQRLPNFESCCARSKLFSGERKPSEVDRNQKGGGKEGSGCERGIDLSRFRIKKPIWPGKTEKKGGRGGPPNFSQKNPILLVAGGRGESVLPFFRREGKGKNC